MIRTRHELTEKAWFITFTCFEWIPLFEITNSYHLVYNWLNIIDRKYQVKTLAFVIMPNHVHVLLQLPESVKSLNTIMANGKRFMAYDLVEQLTSLDQHEILNQLSAACTDKEIAKGQKHKVFEPSFDAKPVYTLPFLHQKLDYIHRNPVSGKWNLCAEFTDYPHSSAAFYHDDKPYPETGSDIAAGLILRIGFIQRRIRDARPSMILS
jgi:REP element-mobilizing transposase RayT